MILALKVRQGNFRRCDSEKARVPREEARYHLRLRGRQSAHLLVTVAGKNSISRDEKRIVYQETSRIPEPTGFEVRSVSEPDLCSDDPSRTLIRQILGAFRSNERAMIVVRCGVLAKGCEAQVGRCEGRKPYGTRPGQEQVVKRMRELRAKGCSQAKITETLNSESKPRAGSGYFFLSASKSMSASSPIAFS